MDEPTPISLRRLVAEGIAVVVSILLAFAIQAWWDGVGEDKARELALRQVQTDFVAMKASADSVLEIQTAHLGSAEALLNLIEPNAPSRVPIADSLLAEVVSGDYREFHGDRGSATTSSTRVDVVEDPRLRQLLAQWTALVEEVASLHSQRQTLMQTRLGPYLQSRVPVRTLDVALGKVNSEGSEFTLDASPLLRDLEFENLINEEVFLTTRVVESLDEVSGAASEILELIRAELAR